MRVLIFNSVLHIASITRLLKSVVVMAAWLARTINYWTAAPVLFMSDDISHSGMTLALFYNTVVATRLDIGQFLSFVPWMSGSACADIV